MADVNAELKAHQAQVTAAKTELGAIRQTYEELLGRIHDVQAELATANTALSAVRSEAAGITVDAQRRAGVIVDEADKVSREANAALAAAEADAGFIRAKARDDAAQITAGVSGIREQQQAARNELNASRSEIDRLKKQARAFADG